MLLVNPVELVPLTPYACWASTPTFSALTDSAGFANSCHGFVAYVVAGVTIGLAYVLPLVVPLVRAAFTRFPMALFTPWGASTASWVIRCWSCPW